MRALVLILFLTPPFFFASCKTPGKTITDAGTKIKKLSQEEQLYNTALFIDANRERYLGNDDKALALYAQCIKKDVAYAPAMYEMAMILEGRNQFEDAITLIKGAIKYEPDNKWYHTLAGQILMNQRKYDEAIKEYKLMSEKFPDEIECLYNWAGACLYAGKYADAIKVYDHLEQKIGITEEISLQKQKLYIQIGKFPKAVDEVMALIKEFPFETGYLGILAELYLADGTPLKAYEVYEQILQINPADPIVHLSLWDYYLKQNKKDEAFSELKIAFANPELEIDAKIRIMLNYYDESETDANARDQAYELSHLLVTAHPEEAKAWSMYGDFLYRDNKLSEARDVFRKVISIDSSRYAIWQTLLIIDSDLKDYTSMFDESRRVLELFPEQAEPWLFNGVAALKLNKPIDALTSLKTGLNLIAGDLLLESKFYTYIGDAQFKLKNLNEAWAAYEEALAIDPENVYVLNNYSFYLAVHGKNLDKAALMAKKANEILPGINTYQDTYAWVLFKSEKYTEARTWAEMAIESGGNNSPVILEHYADILFKLGEIENAVVWWQKAIDAGGDNEKLGKKIKDRQLYE